MIPWIISSGKGSTFSSAIVRPTACGFRTRSITSLHSNFEKILKKRLEFLAPSKQTKDRKCGIIAGRV
jgi:hypothetical protein